MRTETFFYNSARRQGKITGPPVLQIAGVNTTFSYGGLAKVSLLELLPIWLASLDKFHFLFWIFISRIQGSRRTLLTSL